MDPVEGRNKTAGLESGIWPNEGTYRVYVTCGCKAGRGRRKLWRRVSVLIYGCASG